MLYQYNIIIITLDHLETSLLCYNVYSKCKLEIHVLLSNEVKFVFVKLCELS